MRERINHKATSKLGSVDLHFWEEYKQRGFRVDPNNDGCFHAEARNAFFSKKDADSYEVAYEESVRFNIVSAASFMKTVLQIEGLVKYKLFK